MEPEPTRWWIYIHEHARHVNDAQIARSIGCDKSTLTRWKGGAVPDPRLAIEYARAYGRPVAEALAAAEIITDAEADLRVVTSLKLASTDEIVDELRERARGYVVELNHNHKRTAI